jgi:hypothetical protein
VLTDSHLLDPSTIRRADVVIVGAGAVGLTMAVELARAGKDVIVLEAGGETVETSSQAIFEAARWRGYPLEGLHVGRLRALGGTTNSWAGQLVVFDRIVFEERPWVADIGWPIARADLDDAYRRAFGLLGLSRQIDDAAVWTRFKVEPPPAGPDVEFLLTRWTPETNFARLFARDIKSSPRLRLVVNAPVVALALADDGATVDQVVVKGPDGGPRRFGAGHIVLANGTIEIARLLSVPLADGRAPPWSENPWLGRGFLEHIDASAGAVTVLDRERFHGLFDSGFVDGLKYKPKLKLSEAAQRRDKLVGIAADFLFNSNFPEELATLKSFARGVLGGRLEAGIRAYPFNDPGRLVSLARIAVPMVARYLRHRRTYNPADEGIQLRLSTEQKPLRESSLRLLGESDRLGLPRIEVDWLIDGAEIETMARFAETVAVYLERSNLARVMLDESLIARSREFLRRIDDANHHMGMARMAASANKGVVDRELRVFGSSNLHVAGAAVFPTSGFANPTFTAIALGLRLAKALTQARTG